MIGRSGSLLIAAVGLGGGGGGGALGATCTGGGAAVATWNSGTMATGGGGFTRSGGGGGGALGCSLGVLTVAFISDSFFSSAPWFRAPTRPKITATWMPTTMAIEVARLPALFSTVFK